MTPVKLKELTKLTLANFPLIRNTDISDVLKLWTKHFGEIPDDLLQTAFHLVLARNKYWPSVKDIQDAINELKFKENNVPLSLLSEPEISPESQRNVFLALKKAKSLLLEDKLKEFNKSIDIEHVRDYTKRLFPEISDNLIRENIGNIEYAKEATDLCSCCMWDTANCETGGFYPILKIKRSGYVSITMSPCRKKTTNKKERFYE